MATAATVTAKIGPAVQATALVINNILEYRVEPGMILAIRSSDQPNRWINFDLSGVTTFTTTISGSSYAITIS